MKTLIISLLNKKYNNKTILDNINLEINQGEIIGLIGKNGAGKTTLMKAISDLIKYQGEIIRPEEIGLMLDITLLDYLSAYDNIKLLAQLDNVDLKEVNDLFDYVELTNVKHKKVNTYSMGMKQRLNLIQAIMGNKKLILLDEPFNGLDPIGKEKIKEYITQKVKEKKTTIIISSHDLTDISELCNRVLFLDKHKIIYDSFNSNLEEQYEIILENNEKIIIKQSELNQKIKDIVNQKIIIKNINKKEIYHQLFEEFNEKIN